MSALEIVRPGLVTIVVDRGRTGYRHAGVAVCGALDARAFAAANLLAGNEHGDAVLEIAYGSFSCRFVEPVRFALAGANCDARLDGVPIEAWTPCDAPGGSLLELGTTRRGVRTYLAVCGGFNVPLVLGSRSTDLRGGFGGWCGRALRSGDVVPLYPAREGLSALAVVPQDYGDAIAVRAFGRNAPDAFWKRSWRVSHESNRMGCRLLGDPVTRGGEVDSYATYPGVVQLPPSGEPIVLLADAQTTGGYTPIAAVIADDLSAFAQVSAGDLVRFVEVAFDAH